ncbi:MAG: proline dehydrogenase family protein [Candidatus Omnitrophica bacterium]|nr:proline dehydrogenase family protein [Candidatus Omnitrophota bacterium]
MTEPSREQRIQDTGRRLLELARREEAVLAKKYRFEYALLDWCMANDELKTRVFRFIDVFPQLRTADQVVRHIREYFPQSEHRIPASIRAGLTLTRAPLLTKNVLNTITRSMFARIARLFIAAQDTAQVMKVLDGLDEREVTASIDLLGERTLSDSEAEDYFHRYYALIEAFGRRGGDISRQNISVKLSALDPLFDPIDPEGSSQRVRRRLSELLRAARAANVFVHIDMEEYAVRDLTLTVVRDVLQDAEFLNGIDIGIVLQAYLRDADECLDDILGWARTLSRPVTVRLVRGAYWDQEIMLARANHWTSPVFHNKQETDLMFERLIDRILDEPECLRLAVATHNVRSIACAMTMAEEKGVSHDSFEFQLLYGMGAPLVEALRQLDYTPRVYMPIGDAVLGMSYLVRRLLENVSSQSFVRRGIHEKADPQTVLAPPEEIDTPPINEESGGFEPCPPLEFFEEAPRIHFIATLARTISEGPVEVPLIINGNEIFKPSPLTVLSPNDGKTPVVRATMAEAGDVEQALSAAQLQFPAWSRRPMSERADYLRKAAQWMSDHRSRLAASAVIEVGKPLREADADVKEAIDFLNYYAWAAERMDRTADVMSLADEINTVVPVGRGVTAVIAPWNFPLAILTGMSAAALVMGNTVILKPAEQSMLCGLEVMNAYRGAGIPAGVVNFLPGRGEDVGVRLTDDERVKIIAFTGSRTVGTGIIERVHRDLGGRRDIKKLIVEMGGKNAAIVDGSADFDQAIPAVLASAFGFAGQKCSALSRLIVLDDIYDDFVARLCRAAPSVLTGSALDPLTGCGPVIDPDALQRIRKVLTDARDSGTVAYQAALPEGMPGYFIPPTIITGLPAASPLLREEIFGPVLAVLRAGTLAEALRIANDSDYALTGGIFSRTPSSIARAKRDLQVGNLYVNRIITGALVGRHPFGGYKMSGTGTKAGGAAYLREFCVERTISENVMRHGFAPLGED